MNEHMDALKHSGTERFALRMPPTHRLLLLLAHITVSIGGGAGENVKLQNCELSGGRWVLGMTSNEHSLYGAYIRNHGTVNGQ